MASINFDANTIEPSTPMTPIPPGEYQAMITESEMKSTKSGTGQYLTLTWTITDGEYTNRKLWSRLNLDNPNAQAVEIAQRDLSAICHAVGKLRVSDSAELHLIPCKLSVIIKPANGDYAAGNEIKGYSSLSGNPPAPRIANAAPAAVAASAAPAPASTGKPPWARKSA